MVIFSFLVNTLQLRQLGDFIQTEGPLVDVDIIHESLKVVATSMLGSNVHWALTVLNVTLDCQVGNRARIPVHGDVLSIVNHGYMLPNVGSDRDVLDSNHSRDGISVDTAACDISSTNMDVKGRSCHTVTVVDDATKTGRVASPLDPHSHGPLLDVTVSEVVVDVSDVQGGGAVEFRDGSAVDIAGEDN